MAYPPLRSMNSSLVEGATDGRYKKVISDRDGVVDSLTYANRDELDDVWYGIHEVNPKDVPGMSEYKSTPNYRPTAEPNMARW